MTLTYCVFAGCARERFARGLCKSHYRQLLRRGMNPDKLTPLRLETWVKMPAVHITPRAAAKLRKVNRNLYRAVQSTLERVTREMT